MKESYWGYWLIVLGIFIVGVMLLINGTTTNSTQDYYTLKEVTQAAMVDAVDFAYYRLYGNVKMSEQKFVESFLRRFADTTNLSNTYDVEFYDLYEVPPKVSVRVSTKTNSYNVANDQTSFDVTNTIDAILEWEGSPSGSGCSGDNCKKMTCPLEINLSLGYAAKRGELTGSHGINWNDVISSAMDSCNGKENWYQCDAVKYAIERRIGNIDTATWDELTSSYPELDDWLKKGYVTIKETES